MRVVHIELDEANVFVGLHHRHHQPVRGHRFSIGAEKDFDLVGVAIVGRPVARGCNQTQWVEVLRLCTDGTKNACSFLYSAAARIARELGYWRIQTYILASEHGTSLRAAGWERGHSTAGGDWNCRARTGRRTDQPQEPKVCWHREL